MSLTVQTWSSRVRHLVPAPLRTRSYPLRRHIWQRLNNPSGKSSPVFLVGCGRSGTSMLVFHLSRSWQIDLYNEDHPHAFVRWRLREPSVVRALVQKSKAQVVLFKPILDTHMTQELLKEFAGAKALFVFRHYDDVINSSLKKFGIENWKERVDRWIGADFAEFSTVPPSLESRERIRRLWQPALSPESATALYWLFYNSLYYDLGLYADSRVHLVQYENLVSAPQQQFDAICKFLSISLIPDMMEGVFATSIARQAQPKIEQNIRDACEQLWQKLSRDVNRTG